MSEIHTTEKKPPEPTGKPVIEVTFNGVDHQLEYNPKEAVQALLEQAMNAFKVQENRHLMALFTASGVELPLDQSVQHAGVKPGELLVLRPSAVRGG
jgi:hypothetical protein